MNSDILMCISNYLSVSDIIALSLSNASIHKIFTEKLHEFRHRCEMEITDSWNSLVPMAEERAKSRNKEYESPVCSGWEASIHDELYCATYQGKIHSIRVVYVHNPRDVDLVAWYLDNNRIGYTML